MSQSPATRGVGIVTTDYQMHTLCHWQTMLKLHNEFFKFNDVFRVRVYRKTSADERFERKRTDEDRQYGPEDGSAMGLRARQGLEMDKAKRKAAIEDADEMWEPERKRFLRESKQQREELERAKEEKSRAERRFKMRGGDGGEWQAAKDKVERLQRVKDENDKFYQTTYKKTLRQWYAEDVDWPLLHRYGPQDVLKVQNDDIEEPRALYKRNLPEVHLGSPEAKKYIHDLDNVFWEDYGRWFERNRSHTPPEGQGDPSPEIPEFLAMWRELVGEMIDIELADRNRIFLEKGQ